MKYLICVGMIVLLSSCSDMGSKTYTQAFENCMSKLESSHFGYTVRVDMCKEYATNAFYRGKEDETRQ